MRIIELFQERSSKLSNGSERKTLWYLLMKSTKSGAGLTGILPVPCWRCWTQSRITVSWTISCVNFLFYSNAIVDPLSLNSMDLPVDLSRVLFVCTGTFGALPLPFFFLHSVTMID